MTTFKVAITLFETKLNGFVLMEFRKGKNDDGSIVFTASCLSKKYFLFLVAGNMYVNFFFNPCVKISALPINF